MRVLKRENCWALSRVRRSSHSAAEKWKASWDGCLGQRLSPLCRDLAVASWQMEQCAERVR